MKEIIFKGEVSLDNYNFLFEKIISFFSPNSFFLLSGCLGAGKTTFVKLLAKKIGIEENVCSPTFNILNRYKINNYLWLNHFDFFRLRKNEDVSFFEDFLQDSINIIEWPYIVNNFWSERKKKIFIFFDIQEKDDKIRIITVHK